ncbi:MAG: TRAP transporter large permease [Dehalococcoidia bacterium]
MDFTTAALTVVLGMLFLMMMGMPVVFSLGVTSMAVAYFAYGPFALEKIGWTTFGTLYTIDWTPLPLFVLMACLIAETRMGEDIYYAARNWLSRVPGGLIVTSIFGTAAMGAAIGTSTAAVLAVGKVADSEFKRYGYDRDLSLGALICGGVLGPLVPPSIGFIMYGVLSETSIGHLFIAGIIPAIVLAAMLSIAAILICWRNPERGPTVKGITWSQRFSSLKRVWPIVVIMLSIVGSIYMGIATPTEAAGVGCVIVLIIAIAIFNLRWEGFKRALVETAFINGMVLFMMVGAWLFSYVLGTSAVAKSITSFVTSGTLSPWMVVIAINILLLILGIFIDAITIMLLTVPLFVPIIVALGFDPVWFGVLYVVNMETGLITPPMGLQIFMMRTAFDVPVGKLIRGVLPFMVVLFLFLAIMIAFPEISLWLPSMMIR